MFVNVILTNGCRCETVDTNVRPFLQDFMHRGEDIVEILRREIVDNEADGAGGSVVGRYDVHIREVAGRFGNLTRLELRVGMRPRALRCCADARTEVAYRSANVLTCATALLPSADRL